MKRNSQKGIRLLLLVHSLGLLITLGYVLLELIRFIPHMQGRGMMEVLIIFLLDKGLGWLLIGTAFLQYLRKVNRDWQGEGFRGRILFQLYSAYYLLELFRLYGARVGLTTSMGIFFYVFLLLFALQGAISVVLYMVRSLEKPEEEDEEKEIQAGE